MKWNKFRLTTTTEAEDIVSSMLMDLGIQGVEIEDKVPLTQSDKEQMFVDILPETEADDGVAYLSFYLEEDEDKEKVLADVRIEATYENTKPTDQDIKVMIGNIIDDKDVQDKVGYGKYDIVVANILADVLAALTPVINIKDGGILHHQRNY